MGIFQAPRLFEIARGAGPGGMNIVRSLSAPIARRKLVPHPASPPGSDFHVEVVLGRLADGGWTMDYRVEDPADALLVPEHAMAARADGLWSTTCFELFVTDPAGGYREFNFAPSGRWAAYRFDGYRKGMREFALFRAPVIEMRREGAAHVMHVRLGAGAFPHRGRMRVALTAVIEEKDGTHSYWSVSHPPDRPDFHDPACFTLELAAPEIP